MEYPFALTIARIETRVTGFASQARKKRATFLAQSSTLYSFLFEDILKCLLPIEIEWVMQTMSPKEREPIAVKRHYRTWRLKTMENISPPV